MKLGLRSGSLSLALLLGIAGAGCGDDDGMVEVDSGTDAGGGVDSGPPQDTGPPEDTGVDGGPPPVPVAYVRVAHLSPNAQPVRLCLNLLLGDMMLGTPTGPLPTDSAIPFRGISPYLPFDLNEGITYRVNVFEIGEGGAVDCTDTPLLTVDVDTADLEPDAFYTAGAIGLKPIDAEGTLPSVCPNGEMPPTFTQPCPAPLTARIELFEDDSALDAAASKIRVLHAIPNAPAVDVCYDDDPEDETPPVAIASNLSFGNASDYFESPAEIADGVITVHAHVPSMSCVPAATLAPLPVAGFLAALRANEDFAPVLAYIPESFELNRIYTIFAQGQLPEFADESDTGVLFLPWQDQPLVVEE
jgi:hypothetical protein